ncbi:dihydropteroate synthase [Candidatus Woesearchaeota archaeon]|nr:dihydropteroate synthase [Candidatus Woesearchaeota archaeon]
MILASKRPLIMGIVNVTPDSFSDGGLFFTKKNAMMQAKRMVAEGTDILDIGGESSRPGSGPVSIDEELRRVAPVIASLKKRVMVPLSIDTCKPEVAEACLKLGALVINDINGLRNPQMVRVAAKYKAAVVIMHMQGKPKTMQKNPQYKDVVKDIKVFLKKQVALARKAGIRDIAVDPGIGFGKTVQHNLEILKRLGEFKDFGCPLLLGVSRKSFIGTVTGLPPKDRLEGTLASIAVGIFNGADIVRVHDVKEAQRAVLLAQAIKEGKTWMPFT